MMIIINNNKLLTWFTETRGSPRLKPKPEKVSLVSSTLFGGWLIIRDYVHDLFGQCKDPQYLMLVNLLDEISCFNFFSTQHSFVAGTLMPGWSQCCGHQWYSSTFSAETMTRQRCANWVTFCSIFPKTMALVRGSNRFCRFLQRKKLKFFILYYDGKRESLHLLILVSLSKIQLTMMSIKWQKREN